MNDQLVGMGSEEAKVVERIRHAEGGNNILLDQAAKSSDKNFIETIKRFIGVQNRMGVEAHERAVKKDEVKLPEQMLQ